jgi:outer membrane receptor protein involved in Fe transport
VVQRQYRGYAYTDAADAGKRKIFFFPDRATHNIFATYNFRVFSKWRTTVQLNVSNVFDSNRIVYMVRQTNGDFRFAREFMAPRLSSLTFTVAY